jgi:Flp pilus assembly protein TadG
MVEFALGFPVFLVMVTGIIELSLIMFVSVLVEGGLREASRYGITGAEAEGTTREEQVIAIVQRHTHGLVDISSENVTFLVYPSFGDIGEPEPLTVDVDGDGVYDPADGDEYDDVNGNGTWDEDMGAEGLGGPAQVVLYRVNYGWELVTPLLTPVFGGEDGKIEMEATVAVRNEPYNDGEAGS